MLIKNVNQPQVIRVGDVSFHILKVGERTVKLGVDAPREMKVDVLSDVPDPPKTNRL